MLEQINFKSAKEVLQEVIPEVQKTNAWLERLQTSLLSKTETRFFKAAADSGEMCETARKWLNRLPLKSERNEKQLQAGKLLVNAMAGLCWKFTRTHRSRIFAEARKSCKRPFRLEALAESAAELCPGVYPSLVELGAEQSLFLRDKDGLELHQGMLFSQWFSDEEIGNILIRDMRQPLPESLDRVDELLKTNVLDLEYARIEIYGEVATIFLKNANYLNAEDDSTLGATETAVDLALLHPEVKVGVLRGEKVAHPKYAGRRIFSAGINLTKLYQGTQSYLFYLTRELGLVNKLFRGFCGPEWLGDELEHGKEIPWIAVVEGFAIGGGCQYLLVMDYVLAESGSYLNLPARKEGIIPGCANLRLPRMVGDRIAYEAILFDRQFPVEAPESRMLVNEVCSSQEIDHQLHLVLDRVTGSGLVSASGNRKTLRSGAETIESFRNYMAQYAYEQAFCHLSSQLIKNLEFHWKARER
ncbi:MAG: enoyl-CoA hydratase/isomerase family protein [SAR324 cluster bacterium]|nr:enoyl-CoA hydratase/isomerase family protein [SAR324 cluster bacterium]MBL7034184.1 enoyl-CoA hydratase/isomerase family protein [SAR324 cluster bacterium]